MSFLINKLWYGHHPLQWVLRPFSWIYQIICFTRRIYLQQFSQIQYGVPVIVVGNITVGGVGKTPLVIELAKKIQEKGLKVGIVSRGYGSKIKSFPYEIHQTDLAEYVGDEPLLLARKTNCPVVISPKRTQAALYLLQKHKVQVIISDDGLQHYRMGRAIEIAVVDGMRGLGNGLCLPAGPLRERKTRLKQVDFIIVNEGTWENAYPMHLIPGNIIKLSTQEQCTPDMFTSSLVAIAAIGNPQRFYSTLAKLGLEFTPYSYPDHYQFKVEDLDFKESQIIMTEKDAVKCHSFISDKLYYLPVEAQLSDAFWQALWAHKHLQGYS